MTLVIMAAGMGSRFGGLKQVEPVGENGEVILDYSVYDAIRAGFDHVVFIIKKEIDEIFRKKVGDRLARQVKVDYAYQEVTDVPAGVVIPPERKKPWGTAHALYCARHLIQDAFLVINADDFYGKESFTLVHDFLGQPHGGTKEAYCMAGYLLHNTLTENGTVSRGQCETDTNGYLTNVTERTKIERKPDGTIAYADGDRWITLPEDTIVSMNFWGFTPKIFERLEDGMQTFFSENAADLSKCEYYLPTLVKESMANELCDVKVLPTAAKWYGITYAADKENVTSAIAAMHHDGIYPAKLWN